MEKETAFEIRRQAFHLTFGVSAALIIYYNLVDWRFFAFMLAIGMILSLASTKTRLPIVSWFLETFERKKSIPGKGALLMTAGILLSLLLFEKSVAVASIMILAVGDSVSHPAGKLLGRTKHPFNKRKLLEGTIIGFVLAAVAAMPFVRVHEALIGAGIAMTVESFEIKIGKTIIDDNLTIPLIAGAAITLIRL